MNLKNLTIRGRISSELRRVRKNANLSIWKLAQISKLKPAQLFKYEWGLVGPPLCDLTRFMEACCADEETLLFFCCFPMAKREGTWGDVNKPSI